MDSNGTIWLACGVGIALTRLRQRRIYINVIEGVPCRSVNDRWLANLRQPTAGSTLPRYLVPPIQTRRWQQGDPDKGWFLPDKECTAIFRGPSLRADDDYITELAVVFFQEQWAMPIDAEVLAHLRGIDWFKLAEESNWT